MCDVEYHTSCYLRDLLVTRSHREDEARGFMTTWNREEFWHGEALSAVLKQHGIHVDYDELKAKRIKLGWQLAMGPVKQATGSNLVGDDFIAVHMTWGAANELSAVAAYRRMAAMQDHPVLSRCSNGSPSRRPATSRSTRRRRGRNWRTPSGRRRSCAG
ncbi:hypothetical protein [Tessaracoccus coleopterorum]|uniref:hypothetical protein n=1 Tax=Tessaracoccus coleopterorum TaxID=2714950 RepID=UPI0018D32F0E|nr:hypothetical protein [Tessaracoccus coleopterorum]